MLIMSFDLPSGGSINQAPPEGFLLRSLHQVTFESCEDRVLVNKRWFCSIAGSHFRAPVMSGVGYRRSLLPAELLKKVQ